MKQFALILAILMVGAAAIAQTVTVAKSGTPDYGTIQAAIDHFDPDPDAGTPNVIQITDDGSYDEVITIDVPVTIEGTGLNRPIVLVQTNPATAGANDGILITMATGTFNDVTLRNLIVIPSLTTPPTDDGIVSIGQNLNILLENVLVTANDGSGQPLSVDGIVEEDTTGSTAFGDDGLFLGGTTTPAGDGTEVVLRNVIVTHNYGSGGTTGDGIVCSGSGTSYTFEDGCVFSYNGRLGIQGNGSFVVNAPNERLQVIGNKGFAGIWFVGVGSGAAPVRNLNGVNAIGNAGYGIEQQNGGGIPFNLSNALVLNNGNHGIRLGAVGTDAGMNITNVTIAGNVGNAFEVGDDGASGISSGDVVFTDCVIAGLSGTGTINHIGTGTFTINDSAVVTAGPYALASPAIIGTGTVIQNNVINDNPAFINTSDINDPRYFWTSSLPYQGAGSGGSDLGGGAGFELFVPTAVQSPWELYL